jgi:hypothetical protein
MPGRADSPKWLTTAARKKRKSINSTDNKLVQGDKKRRGVTKSLLPIFGWYLKMRFQVPHKV